MHSLFFLLGDRLRKPPYFFVPISSGPWSFQLEADLQKLQKEGSVQEKEGRVELIEDPGTKPDPQWEHGLEKALDKWENTLATALLDRFELPDATLPTPALFTIGYEGRPLELYMTELLKRGVRALCDVRKDPVSRKFGFSKKILEHACSTLGVCYLHLPELGISKELRNKISDEASRKDILHHYERDMLPKAAESLRSLERLLREEGRIALTCYEAAPLQCHRSRVARALITRKAVGNAEDL